MLNANNWNKLGLSNGSIGIVKEILFSSKQNETKLPLCVLV